MIPLTGTYLTKKMASLFNNIYAEMTTGNTLWNSKNPEIIQMSNKGMVKLRHNQ